MAEAILDRPLNAYEAIAAADVDSLPGDDLPTSAEMTDEELQSVVDAEITDAVSYIDSEIAPQRADAVDAYFGRLYGDEEEGRSQVVSRDVHDTIQALTPSLMRIFFGPEHVVEFEPDDDSPEDLQMADQATDYVTYVITRDNDGFNILMAVIKNALREKVGIVKFWWDRSVQVSTKTYTGLTEDTLTKLMDDLQQAHEATLIEVTEDPDEKDDDGAPLMSAKLRLKTKNERVRIEALPPEEFLIGRRMKTLDDEGFVAHRCMKTVSELVAMGYDRELVEAQSETGDELAMSAERQAREGGNSGFPTTASADKSQRLVLYIESYVNVDYDGDGIAELRRICTIGPGHRVLANEPIDRRLFADFQCDPEPHTFFGQSVYDKTSDIQRVKTNVWRGSMDSLAQSIFPRMIVVDSDGHMEDALNNENGALLRAKSGSGYVPLATPFVGQAAFPMLTYLDEVRENRTGMSKVSQGLDAEALQNTTATAAEGQFTRSQDRIDLLARVLASGMKRLCQGILYLLVENQRGARKVKLGAKGWASVDPRPWKANMDVICNVGLGGGSDGSKVATLMSVAEVQKEIIQAYGVDNPLCGPEEFRNTQIKMLELRGFKNHTLFFKDIPQGQPLQFTPPPPTADMIKAQTAAKALDVDTQERQARFQLDAVKQQADIADRQATQARLDAQAQNDAQMAAAKLEQDGAVAIATINAQFKGKVTAAEIHASAQALRVHADLAIQASEAHHGKAGAAEPVERAEGVDDGGQ